MSARFTVAVDVGTTRIAAATARITAEGAGVALPFRLGRHVDTAPSVVFIGDGELLFGDAAERRGVADPDRFVREVKRRIGDDVPILAGDARFTPEQLYAAMVAWVIDTIAAQEGAMPVGVAIAVPVTWGARRSALVLAALAREGWEDVQLITEPEAAVRHYEHLHPLPAGGTIGVYDLGGGTFDAAVMRREEDGDLTVVGRALGIPSFGGADVDDLVFAHALDSAGVDRSHDDGAASTRLAFAALRRECTDAKEALSFDSEAILPVLVGPHRRVVRIVRSELEDMIHDGIARTVGVFDDVLDGAGLTAGDLDVILLTGGSSRIPHIAQVLSERFERPIAVDADPKAIIALGAARASAERLAADVEPRAEAVDPAPAAPDVAPPRPARTPRRRRFGVGPAIALAGGALVLAAGIVVSVGLPDIAGTATTTTIDAPVPSRSASPAPSATEAPPSVARPADSVELTQRVAPTPRETPLLSTAPDSDRIQNLQPALTTEPSPADEAP